METQSKVLKWSLIIGIVIVLNLFFNYVLSLAYKNPKFEAFCPVSQVIENISTQKQCVDVGGQWNPNNYAQPIPAEKIAPQGYCDQQLLAEATLMPLKKFTTEMCSSLWSYSEPSVWLLAVS